MTQSGRSMVEMLGVLAVIGVLSIAGIAGYNSAMNKEKANKLINLVSVESVHLSSQVLSGATTLTASQKYTPDITVGFEKNNQDFYIEVPEVSKVVCEHMFDMGMNDKAQIYPEDKTDPLQKAECAEGMSLSFVYTPQLTKPAAVRTTE